MFRNLFAAALTVSLAAGAYAASGKITAVAEVKKNEKVFVLQDRGSSTYSQISAESESETRMTGNGIFSRVDQRSRSTEALIPGINSGGHSRISLYQDQAGNTYMNVDIEADVQSDGFSVKMPLKYSVPLRFTSGSWAAYQSGQPVELRPTDAGEQISAEMATAKMRTALTQMRAQLENQLAASGVSLGEVKLEKLTVKGKSVIRGDINRLVISGSPLKVEMSFGVRL